MSDSIAFYINRLKKDSTDSYERIVSDGRETKAEIAEKIQLLEEEQGKILQEIKNRYKELKASGNGSLSIAIERINSSFAERFIETQETFYKKLRQNKVKKIGAFLEEQKSKARSVSEKQLELLTKNLSAEDKAELQRKLEDGKHEFEKKLGELNAGTKNSHKPGWLLQKETEATTAKRVNGLSQKILKKGARNASPDQLQSAIDKERESLTGYIHKRFDGLERKLAKNAWNKQVSQNTKTAIRQQNEQVQQFLQDELARLSAAISQPKAAVHKSKMLIHAARSLEYLSLQFDELNNDHDFYIYDMYYQDNNLRKLLNYHIKESIQALEKTKPTHQELIQKAIDVLSRTDTVYKLKSERFLTQYTPAPTQAEINELLKQLEQKETVYNYYSPHGGADTLIYRYKNKTPVKSAYDVERLKEMLNEELILIGSEKDTILAAYLEKTLALNRTMELWLKNISDQFDTLRSKLDELETEYAPRAQEAHKQARHLSTLLEISVHVLDAFKYNSLEVDSICVTDTLAQRIEEVVDNKNITYDRLQIKPKAIATGPNVNRWINREQFRQVMEDPLKRQAYLGLLYQRLANIQDFDDVTPEGVALVTTKLIHTIYDMDELRETLQFKKKSGKNLNFQDYYPFIRTTVDFLNTLLETPVGNRSFSEQHKELRTFSVISDQSLKLLENIFDKNYGLAIDNLVNMFAYIWDADLEEAEKDQWQRQALPALRLQGENEQAAAIEKRLNEQNEKLKKGQKENLKLKKALLAYGKFMSNIAIAEDADAVKAALNAVAVPPGSSSVKRAAHLNVSLNGYFGLGGYAEILKGNGLDKKAKTKSSIGLSVPVGVAVTWGGFGLKNQSFSIFIPVIDLGVVTAYRLDAQNTGVSDNLPELSFSNLIAPGIYAIYNFPRSPFSVSAGAQIGPQLRKITTQNGAEIDASALRFGATFTIDVPILNLHNR